MGGRATSSLIAVFVACLLAPGVAAAGTLDQQQPADDDLALALAPSGSGAGAQTFTAGITGGLDQGDLALARIGTPLTYLTVEIRDVSGGAPGQAVLAARSIPPSAVTNTTAQFIPVQFNLPAPVVAGTQYAIVAYSGNSSDNWYDWYLKNSDVYSGGQLFDGGATPPSMSWTAAPTDDLEFKTFVVPAPLSTAGPTGQRAAALRKCKRKHGKKRKKCKQRANLLPV